jgi:hypothetical protein
VAFFGSAAHSTQHPSVIFFLLKQLLLPPLLLATAPGATALSHRFPSCAMKKWSPVILLLFPFPKRSHPSLLLQEMDETEGIETHRWPSSSLHASCRPYPIKRSLGLRYSSVTVCAIQICAPPHS